MNTVITIGRQFGSAGREIGEQVAKEFGIKYYDKELLSRAAKESGFFVKKFWKTMMNVQPVHSFIIWLWIRIHLAIMHPIM